MKLTPLEAQMFEFLFDRYGSGNFLTIPKFIDACQLGSDSSKRTFINKMRKLRVVVGIGYLGREDYLNGMRFRVYHSVGRAKAFMVAKDPCKIVEARLLILKATQNKIKI